MWSKLIVAMDWSLLTLFTSKTVKTTSREESNGLWGGGRGGRGASISRRLVLAVGMGVACHWHTHTHKGVELVLSDSLKSSPLAVIVQ